MKMNTRIARRPFENRKSGMTLIEIILVIALIVLLLSAIVGNVGGIFGGAQEDLARVMVKDSYKLQLTRYKIDMGSYPSTAQGLKALLQDPGNSQGRWRGPYLEDQDELVDPWKTPLQYKFPGVNNTDGYDLYSLGPDKVESDDDITNW